MNTKKILGLLIASTLLSSCATTVTVPGFERTVFVDYSQFRANGIEITDGEVPTGRTPIGQISEIIRFSRTYTTEKQPTNSNDDIIVPKRKERINGDFDSDMKTLSYKIACITKEKGGKGIAKIKINVNVVNADTHPVYCVTGIIYK
ncbi:hypothetical protein [Prevotella nigrescens]|uniref:hypothetical protein n=1 Tax=Prevotella nigrescens TaxID=28133 RepID=UPI0028F0668C|nr:hypothetical protein [Prevotella nigrescens]